MWFGYNPQINFCHFFGNLNLAIFGHFDNESEWTVGTLCAQLLQFHVNCFKTLYVLWAWSEDMHMVWIKSSNYFLSFFSQIELSHFFGHFSEWRGGTSLRKHAHVIYRFFSIKL